MTLPSTVNGVFNTGNGTARTFSFSDIVIFADDELEVITRVIATGVETVRTLGTGALNYSISIPAGGFPATGSIDFPASGGTLLPSTEEIHIRRVGNKKQETQLSRGPYDPGVQEERFDRFAAAIQELRGVLDRCIRFPATTPSAVAAKTPPPIAGSRYLRLLANLTGWEFVELSSTGTAVASDATPQGVALSSASPGTSADFSRADHAHLEDDDILNAVNIHNALNFI